MTGNKDKREKDLEPEQTGADPGKSGNSLSDASEEAVRFMEQDGEPAHAGRGDGG